MKASYYVNFNQVLYMSCYREFLLQYGEGLHKGKSWVAEDQIRPAAHSILSQRNVTHLHFAGGEELKVYENAEVKDLMEAIKHLKQRKKAATK